MSRRRPYRRSSDRWVTPGVVATGIVCATVAVLGVAYLVSDLVRQGLDPSPVVQLATASAAALGSTLTLILQLVGRGTAAKTERHAGVAASAIEAGHVEVRPAADVDDDQVDDVQLVADQTMWLPPVPPLAARHSRRES